MSQFEIWKPAKNFIKQNFENLLHVFFHMGLYDICANFRNNRTITVGGEAIWKKFDDIHPSRHQSPILQASSGANIPQTCRQISKLYGSVNRHNNILTCFPALWRRQCFVQSTSAQHSSTSLSEGPNVQRSSDMTNRRGLLLHTSDLLALQHLKTLFTQVYNNNKLVYGHYSRTTQVSLLTWYQTHQRIQSFAISAIIPKPLSIYSDSFIMTDVTDLLDVARLQTKLQTSTK